jgi:hypothetical protein
MIYGGGPSKWRGSRRSNDRDRSVKLPGPSACNRRLEPMRRGPDAIFCRPIDRCGPLFAGPVASQSPARDANLTPRRAQRSARGPAVRREPSRGLQAAHARAAAARSFVCDASGEPVEAGGSTPTMHPRASADCVATCARKRVPQGGCSTAGGGQRQAAAPENASAPGRRHQVLRAERGHAAFPSGGDLGGVGLGRGPTPMGSPVSPAMARITPLWMFVLVGLVGLAGLAPSVKAEMMVACRVPGSLRRWWPTG